MTDFFRSVFRHFKFADLGVMIAANLFCIVPLALALVGPLILKSNQSAGMLVLLAGFLMTGQAIALTGRILDRRFRKDKEKKPGFFSAWASSWAEGLIITAVLLGLFSLAFESVPFYWSQGTAFSLFSLATLGMGTLLLMGFLPYYLPARRREGLGLAAAFKRSFRLMNAQPLLALTAVFLGIFSIGASLGTFGLFPGFTGLAALHQGVWDHAVEKESLAD